MAALTAVRPRWYGFLPGQLSTRPHVPFATFSLQPPSASPPRFSYEVLVRGDSPLTRQASPFPSRLADAVGRIEFTFVWDHGSAFGCSPPRLMTTQLPLAALPLLVPGGVGLSPLEFMHVCSHWDDVPSSSVRRPSLAVDTGQGSPVHCRARKPDPRRRNRDRGTTFPRRLSDGLPWPSTPGWEARCTVGQGSPTHGAG